MKKNIIVAVLAFIIICGGILAVTSRMGNTAQELIANAITATANLQSFEAELTSYIEQRNEENGNVTSTATKSELIYFCFPRKYRIESNISVKNLNNQVDTEEYSMDFLRYFTTENADSTEDICYDFNFQESRWDIRRYPANIQMSFGIDREDTIKEDTDFYLRSADNFEKDGEEKIKGYNTVKLTGKIIGDKIGETAKRFITNYDEFIGRASEEIDAVDVAVWIDKKSRHVVKYIIDISDIYQLFYEDLFDRNEIANSLQITMEKYIYETTMFNFNKATDFEIPQEALDAEKNN